MVMWTLRTLVRGVQALTAPLGDRHFLPEKLQIRKICVQDQWLDLPTDGHQRPSRSGAIFLQASTSPCTAPTDLSKASRSLPASSISTMRSTPFDPITTGTPTYMSFTPYSPLR